MTLEEVFKGATGSYIAGGDNSYRLIHFLIGVAGHCDIKGFIDLHDLGLFQIQRITLGETNKAKLVQYLLERDIDIKDVP